jgi:hypothetical protein
VLSCSGWSWLRWQATGRKYINVVIVSVHHCAGARAACLLLYGQAEQAQREGLLVGSNTAARQGVREFGYV